jgi:hypothetical protein
VTVTATASTVDSAAVAAASLAAQQSVAAQSAADKAAADQAAAAKASADQAAAAAAQSAAESAAAESAAAQSAAEQAAAEQSAADQAAEDASGVNGWTDPYGTWISPDTAARALEHGIAPGDAVPGYLRCGTLCGELPTSGEVQWAWACVDGTMDCGGIDAESVLSAAGVSDDAIAAAISQRSQSDAAVNASDDAQKACEAGGGYMVIRGVCYATEAEAAKAGD